MIYLPIDGNSRTVNITPTGVPLATTYDATISSSTAITLNASTTYIEVSAVDKGIFMKWGATAASNSFDEFISPNTTRAYMVPQGKTTVQFIEQAATALLIVVEK